MATVNSGTPAIDYTSKDYSGFLDSMLTYATTAFPEWTNQNPGSLEVMLLESLSRELDVLSYYGDRIVGEAYIGTATQLSSVIQLAALLGYAPGQAIAATGTITLQTGPTSAAVPVPLATQVTTDYISSLNGPIIFETTQSAVAPANAGTVTIPIVQGVTQGSAVFTIGNSTAAPFAITTELLGTSDGSQLQEFTLANNPVVSGSITVYVQNPAYPGTSGIDPITPWLQVASLQEADDSSLSWAETVDANGIVTINFGDGINGAIPAAGLQIYANYRVGGGVIGNLSANSIIDIASPLIGVAIIGSSATTGGTNAETIDQIRVNAPRAFTTQQRAVTLADYGNLAMSLPVVSQANAIANTYTNVTVYVTGSGNTTPNQAVLDTVTSFLQPLSLAGTVVTCTAAHMIPINVGATATPVLIGCSSRYSPTSIKVLATQAIQNLFAPSNVTLAGRVSLSSVFSALYNIPGVQYVNIPLFVRSDATQSGAADILMRSYELPVVGNIVITVTASA
ncbi:MAG TPA: baseplate J/gp47 family protein [Candidatus Saccharimonadales bacterium]|jgi:hypothetical protein